ncbi:MAG: methionyl-tRNA formyltransferase [Acidobacteria bacterium]|jgi:methionyl-tRNA formyltransferase|nr:methionyl-tRNA formyltransferase [Acidobacteriota bacterium]
MKLVFCGTPEFAVPSLRALVDAGHQVSLVLTQPDRPAGRKQEIQLPPVKKLAVRLAIPVMQPERVKNNPELRATLEHVAPDAIIVVAYGRIIPQWMLDLPRYGNINVHGSLLPKYRGAAPIQWAVANGETETGVTTMLLDAGLDTGDTLLFHRVPIGPETTAVDLYTKLAEDGAKLLIETLYGIEHQTIQAQAQDHAAATLAPILTREDGRIDLFRRTAQETYNRWRGFTPWPGAHGMFRGKRFLIHRMRPSEFTQSLAPYQIDISTDKFLVGAAQNTVLALEEVQVDGKPRLSGQQFARDFQVRPGESLA